MPETLAIFKLALMLVVYLSIPPLLVALLAGVVMSIIQTVLQIQDQTLPFVVKLFSVGATLALCGGWIGSEIIQLAAQAFALVPYVR